MTLRLATPADVEALRALIAASVNGLQAGDYDEAQRAGALWSVFGVDTSLIADGTYFVVYNGGETLMPDVTVYQVFTDTECETQAAAHGEECLNGYYVPSDPYRDITDLPFASDLFLSVAHGSTQQSYWITPEELVTIRASSPSGGAPSDYSFTPFPFMMTVEGGEITRFEQLWQP